MARLDETFNVNDMPEGSYDVMQPGWYSACISDADVKETKDGSGKYISVRYDITGPTCQGRAVFGNINIRLPLSPEAENIGRRQLGDIMRAIGLDTFNDTDQLIGGQLMIKLTVSEARKDEKTGKQYDAKNEVRGYKAIGEAMPMTATETKSKTKIKTEEKPLEKGKNPPWGAKK